jgi:ParB family transcriptional regulator, chromosome partitioning protein
MAKRAPARRRPRKAKAGTKGLTPAESLIEKPEGAAADVATLIEKAGGVVVGTYKEPLGGHPALLSVLPIDAIEPTPFQRDLSDAHHKRLADVINRTGRFLDPVIAVTAPDGGFIVSKRCAVWEPKPSPPWWWSTVKLRGRYSR